MMPILVILAILLSIYAITRKGAFAGVKYFLVPNIKNFSWMTVVSAMGQMFYSLSIAMGILITFGSYMKSDLSIEESTSTWRFFDTAIAVLAGLMIIPAVFAFSNGDPSVLKAGPSLMFITMPKIFASMGFGRVVGILFFCLSFLCGTDLRYRFGGKCGFHLPGRARSGAEERPLWVLLLIMVALGTLSAFRLWPSVLHHHTEKYALPGFL